MDQNRKYRTLLLDRAKGAQPMAMAKNNSIERDPWFIAIIKPTYNISRSRNITGPK